MINVSEYIISINFDFYLVAFLGLLRFWFVVSVCYAQAIGVTSIYALISLVASLNAFLEVD